MNNLLEIFYWFRWNVNSNILENIASFVETFIKRIPIYQ